MKIKKIVTHPGAYHADELMAIATIFYHLGEQPIERRIPTYEDIEDPMIFVLDVGGIFDPAKLNFDHHQDTNLPATNVLILEELVRNEYILKHALPFYKHVSMVDKGECKRHVADLSSIVRSMNGAGVDFKRALEFVFAVVVTILDEAIIKVKTDAILDALYAVVLKQGQFKVSQSSDIIPGWEEIIHPEYKGLIQPNSRGGWQVVSRDSSVWTVPMSSCQTFRHNSGFMAVYPDYDSLIKDLNNEQK